VAVATVLAVVAGTAFTAVAMANELALRDHPTASSRFGPTTGDVEPPPCDAPVTIGSSARLELHLMADLDGRPIGSVDLAGDRAGTNFRWLAYAASTQELGLHGEARIGSEAWVRQPFSGWRRSELAVVADGTVDVQAFATALGQEVGDTAEFHGVDVIEGARATHCRIAIDGPTFRRAFPAVAWLIGDDELGRWRGELDYWVFADDQLGRMTGSVNGDAGGIRDGALQGTIRVNLSATSRGSDLEIVPPGP